MHHKYLWQHVNGSYSKYQAQGLDDINTFNIPNITHTHTHIYTPTWIWEIHSYAYLAVKYSTFVFKWYLWIIIIAGNASFFNYIFHTDGVHLLLLFWAGCNALEQGWARYVSDRRWNAAHGEIPCSTQFYTSLPLPMLTLGKVALANLHCLQNFPFPAVAWQPPQTCARCSIGMPDCLF